MDEKVFSSKEHEQKVLRKRFQNLGYSAAILSSLGLALCAYALRVEIMKERDSTYKAFCDIDSYISCTKVFFSKYGKGFGLMPEGSILNQPNTVYGIIFFITQIFLLFFQRKRQALILKLVLSAMANLGNVYLAYILYFILKDFCIVCVGFYIVNGILLVVNFKQLGCKNKMETLATKKKKKTN